MGVKKIEKYEASYNDLSEQAVAYDLVLKNVPVSIYILDKTGTFELINKTGLEMLDLPRNKIVGQNYFELIEGATNLEGIKAKFDLALSGIDQKFNFILPIDKSFLHFNSQFIPIKNETGQVDKVLGFTEDVTEKVVLEEQMLQTAKLATIGELAAGVGHEINNPLTVLLSVLNKLQKEINSSDSMVAELMHQCENSARRIGRIVRGLGSFTRISTNKLSSVNVHDAIANTLLISETYYKTEGIVMETKLNADFSNIHAEMGRLQQVILSILTNARESLARSDKKLITISTYDENDFLKIEITDTGCGIDPSVKDKIFDAFFSTKEVGKGTGLGLSLALSIVRNFTGSIDIWSEPNKGTKVTLKFPVNNQ